MDTRLFIQQVKTFLIESKKYILMNAFILLMISALLQLLISLNMGSQEENTISGGSPSYTHSFEIYVEQEIAGQFLNADLLEEILNQSNVIKEIIDMDNLETESFSEENLRSDGLPLEEAITPIAVEKHPSTNIMRISFGVGTKAENLEVAEAYYKWLETTQLPFFKDKQIYFMSTPNTIESSNVNLPKEPVNIIRVGILLFASLIAGIIFGVVIALLKAIFNKKIMYAFAYHWNKADIFLNFSDGVSAKELENSLIHPARGNKVILSEEKIEDSDINYLMELTSYKNKMLFKTDIHQINSNETIEEFIFIVKRRKTTKAWYQNQRKKLKSYTNPVVKIIQI